MNRIYQGRIVKVEVLDGATDVEPQWRDLPDWGTALWKHHELFQDAVNYYTLCLAALADGLDDSDAEGKALSDWRKQVEAMWKEVHRGAKKFDGPHARIARLLGQQPEQTHFSDLCRVVLKPSRANGKARGAALVQLLQEADKGDLNQVCIDRLPWFATPQGKLNATPKTTKSNQEIERQKFVRKIRDLKDEAALKQLEKMDLGLFCARPLGDKVTGEKAADMLEGYWESAVKKHPDLEGVKTEFKRGVQSWSETGVPSLGRRPSGYYPVAAVAKYLPCKETLAAFREETQRLASAKDKIAVSDAIAASRVEDQPHFNYFTKWVLIPSESGRQDTRAIWFEFDLAAFIEAVKAPHRYYQDTIEREGEADKLRALLKDMEEEGREASSEEGGEDLPGFKDDGRILLLRKIVEERLAWLAEGEEEGKTAGPVEYGVHERTVRGFSEIKRRWRKLAEQGKATEENLLKVVAEEQAGRGDDFGSAALYRELARLEFHSIWRNDGTKEWHAEDPLTAYLDYKNLQRELADKERPIRFTPAHPIHSPRFYIFPKKLERVLKATSRGKPGLSSSHVPGELMFTGGIVLKTDTGWQPTVVRISYAAPRLRRDRLRTPGDSGLHSAPWLQPMMEALGMGANPERVNFANCRITLQPKSASVAHVSFPVEVSVQKIQEKIGKADLWKKQFNVVPDGNTFRESSLRWPHEKKPQNLPEPWYSRIDRFSCLSVDLGQRVAGAYARLEAKVDGDSGKGNGARERPSRFIGEIAGKRWRAALISTGLLRLPGEDAVVWRVKSANDGGKPADSGKPFDFREELWGERGRPAQPHEADDTLDLLQAFGSDERDLLPEGWRRRLTFPEQNDKLLIAARRCQARLRRLHRWCCFLADAQGGKREVAFREIAECEDGRLVAAEERERAKGRDPRLSAVLRRRLEEERRRLPDLLVRLANRCLPLRGRSWRWGPHPDRPDCGLLTMDGPDLRPNIQRGANGREVRTTWIRGQRGLSMERIEQIEDLRRRFQSLNQTLRRGIGEKAPLRRDESIPDPCPDLLEKLDNLKEQRINQTAHLILAEALGLRLAPPPADKAKLRASRDLHGRYERVREPVDFIVIENLSRYRTSQGRARRENSRLMKWCHRAVRDKLRQLCEVFGLPVLETPAAYSSRFCSRSGVAGFRAVEVGPGFEYEAPWVWLKDKNEEGRPTPEAQCVQDLLRQVAEANAALSEGEKPRMLLAPLGGGPIFVPVVDKVDGADLQPAVVQADINAAVNLGLRAIADPRLWNIHPRLRTKRDGKLGGFGAREKRKYGEVVPKLSLADGEASTGDDSKDARNPNYFFDTRRITTWGFADIQDATDPERTVRLVSGKALWSRVNDVQWERCGEINHRRLKSWQERREGRVQVAPGSLESAQTE